MAFYRVVGIFGIPKVRRGFQLSAVHGGYSTNIYNVPFVIYTCIYKK